MGLDITLVIVDKMVVDGQLGLMDTSVFEGEPDRMRSYVAKTPVADQCYLTKEHRGYLEDPIHGIVLDLFGFWEKGIGWLLSLEDLFLLVKTITDEVMKDTNYVRFSSDRVTNYLADLDEIIEVADFDNQYVLYSWC